MPLFYNITAIGHRTPQFHATSNSSLIKIPEHRIRVTSFNLVISNAGFDLKLTAFRQPN
jgi:hypothetical protein